MTQVTKSLDSCLRLAVDQSIATAKICVDRMLHTTSISERQGELLTVPLAVDVIVNVR